MNIAIFLTLSVFQTHSLHINLINQSVFHSPKRTNQLFDNMRNSISISQTTGNSLPSKDIIDSYLLIKTQSKATSGILINATTNKARETFSRGKNS